MIRISLQFLCDSHALNMEVDVISLAAQELGYDRVTSEQRLVVQSFFKDQDVFVSLSTWKSFCYWTVPQQSKGEKWWW